MRITIESTPELILVDGVPVRVWKGVTERGVRCHVLVHRIAVGEGEDAAQFECEMKELPPPPAGLELAGALRYVERTHW